MPSNPTARVLDLLPEKHRSAVWHVLSGERADVITLLIRSDRVLPRASSQHGFISRRQLSRQKKRIQDELGVKVDVQLVDQFSAQLESSLEQILKRQFENDIDACFISTHEEGHAVIWLRVKRGEIPERVIDVIQAQLQLAGLKLKEILDLKDVGDTPSRPMLLRTIKIIAPATLAEVERELTRRDFVVPSRKWLNSAVDTLRKAGLLRRFKDGRYVLTLKGLDAVPHPARRSSSDVERVLALGRRQWDHG